MKVSLISFEGRQNRANVRGYRKEDKFDRGYYALARRRSDGELVSVVDIRTYYPAQTCYCVAWVIGAGASTVFGCGKAGGYGYDKRSGAVYAALADCGIEVGDLSGTGLIADAVKLLGQHICKLYPDYEYLGVFEAFG